jgi:cytochrome c biogenesis protein CcmG, thiol:disulfide interchange protein DsbE
VSGVLRKQPQRVAAILLAFGVLLVAADVIVSRVWTTGSSQPTVESGSISNGRLATGTLLDRPVPGDMTLIDERGKTTPLSSFRGRYLVFAPSMTLCHEVCPMTTAALQRLQSAVGRLGLGSQVTVAEVSIDPWRDTPARLRAYQKLTGLRFRLLTGTQAQLKRMWKFFGVYYRKVPQGKPADVDWLTHKPETFDVQHTDGLFIVDPQGHWRVGVVGMPSTGGRLSPALRHLLNENGQTNLHHPQAPWTAKQALSDLLTVKEQTDARSATGQTAAKAPSAADVRRALAGSPAPLAALHSQSGTLLSGGMSAFKARLAALKGRPVVVNEWASWCFPCRNEFPLFAHASAQYGKRVAFLGVNVSDSSSDAQSFLRAHPVSYPSYTDSSGAIAASFGSAQALPTTIYFNAGGKKTYTHIGYYSAPEALNSDIERYALSQ